MSVSEVVFKVPSKRPAPQEDLAPPAKRVKKEEQISSFFSAAIKAIAAQIESFSSKSLNSKELSVDSLINIKAFIYFRLGDLAAASDHVPYAENHYQTAYSLQPNLALRARILFSRYELHLENQNPAKALKCLKKNSHVLSQDSLPEKSGSLPKEEFCKQLIENVTIIFNNFQMLGANNLDFFQLRIAMREIRSFICLKCAEPLTTGQEKMEAYQMALAIRLLYSPRRFDAPKPDASIEEKIHHYEQILNPPINLKDIRAKNFCLLGDFYRVLKNKDLAVEHYEKAMKHVSSPDLRDVIAYGLERASAL